MASIARLDTLLREEGGGDAGGPHARREKTGPPPDHRVPGGGGTGGGGARTESVKSRGGAERKPTTRAPPAGGIAKSRVRKGGGGKGAKACGSTGREPSRLPGPGLAYGSSSARAETGNAGGNAGGKAPTRPGSFPPLFSHLPAFAGGEGRDRGRYVGAEEVGEAGPPPGAPHHHHHPRGSRFPDTRPQPPVACTSRCPAGSDQRWPTPGAEDFSAWAMPAQYRPRGGDDGRPAPASKPWAPRYPCSPGRHRDTRGGDGSEWDDGHRFREVTVDRRDAWESRGRREGWAGGEPRPDYRAAHGHDRGGGGCREWDRCVRPAVRVRFFFAGVSQVAQSRREQWACRRKGTMIGSKLAHNHALRT